MRHPNILKYIDGVEVCHCYVSILYVYCNIYAYFVNLCVDCWGSEDCDRRSCSSRGSTGRVQEQWLLHQIRTTTTSGEAPLRYQSYFESRNHCCMYLSTNACRRELTFSTTSVGLSMVTSVSSLCLLMLPWSGSWLVWSTLMPSLTVLLPSLPSRPSTTHQRWSREDHTRHTNGEIVQWGHLLSGKQCTGLVYVHMYMYLFGRSADMWGLGVLIYEVYNGELREISDLRNTSKVWYIHDLNCV